MTNYHVTKAVWNRIFSEINEENLNTNYPDCFESVLDYIQKLNLKNIVDIGCGYGKMCMKYWNMGIGDITGIDISEAGITIGQNWSKKTGSNIKYIIQDISYLDLPYKSVESISAFFVLDNFSTENLIKILDNINNAIKEGGYLIYSLNYYDEVKRTDYLSLGDGTFMEKSGMFGGLIINPSTERIIAERLRCWSTEFFHQNDMGQKFYILRKNSIPAMINGMS